MDIIILSTVILAGIALESFISERARRRAGQQNAMDEQLARYADRDVD